MENKRNGSVLVESLIAISITIIALSLVGNFKLLFNPKSRRKKI